jgi:protein TonB
MAAFAFACAIVIHGGAIALGANRAQPPDIVCVLPPAIVEVVVDQTESPPPIDIPPPDPPAMPNVENDFQEQELRSVMRPARIAPVLPTRSVASASFSTVKTAALSAPRPEYPYEARRRRETGSGVAGLTIDAASGTVIEAQMTQTTGSAILDQSTVNTLRRWRFKARTPEHVRVPITFTLTGASF